jgi:hypothetical protein
MSQIHEVVVGWDLGELEEKETGLRKCAQCGWEYAKEADHCPVCKLTNYDV